MPDEVKPDEQPATGAAPDDATPDTAEATDWKAKFEAEREHSRTWEKRAKENKDAAARLKELEDADKTEAQKALDRAEAAEKRLAEAEAEAQQSRLKALKATIGASKGLPPELIDRLQGDDEASITADADALLKVVPKAETSLDIGQGNTGKPAQKSKEDADVEAFAAAFKK